MARSLVGSNKSFTSDERSNKPSKRATGYSNLMTSSMPSSALSKSLYSNVSSSNQKHNTSVNYGNKHIPTKRNPIPKARQNISEDPKKVSKQIRNSQVSWPHHMCSNYTNDQT